MAGNTADAGPFPVIGARVLDMNAYLEALRKAAFARGQTADRVIPVEDESYQPGLDNPVSVLSRCPRFQLMPRAHRLDPDDGTCVYCKAPISPRPL